MLKDVDMKPFKRFVFAVFSFAMPFLTPPLAALGAPTCEKFGECIQQTLNHANPVDRVLYATQALKHWTPDIPERDLLNVLKLRGEALIALHVSGAAPDLDPLRHAQDDYEHFLQKAPGHWMALSGLGRVAELQQNLPTALQHFNQAVKTQSLRLDEREQKREMGMPSLERADLYFLRGQAYAQLKQALDERLDFESACKLGHAAACEAIE